MIEINNLVRKFGNKYAVDDISFLIKTGEIVGFLGPNGAGKSTTMNIITGYLSPTSGTVKVDNIDVFLEPTKAKKKIGFLPEQPPLYIDMTVWEYLSFVFDLKSWTSGVFPIRLSTDLYIISALLSRLSFIILPPFYSYVNKVKNK